MTCTYARVLLASRKKKATHTSCGEDGEELGIDFSGAVLDQAVPLADAVITAREEDADAPHSKLRK